MIWINTNIYHVLLLLKLMIRYIICSSTSSKSSIYFFLLTYITYDFIKPSRLSAISFKKSFSVARIQKKAKFWYLFRQTCLLSYPMSLQMAAYFSLITIFHITCLYIFIAVLLFFKALWVHWVLQSFGTRIMWAPCVRPLSIFDGFISHMLRLKRYFFLWTSHD